MAGYSTEPTDPPKSGIHHVIHQHLGAGNLRVKRPESQLFGVFPSPKEGERWFKGSHNTTAHYCFTSFSTSRSSQPSARRPAMIFGNRAVLSLAFSASASLRASAFAAGARSRSPARPNAASALFSTKYNIEPSRAMKAAEEARQMALAHGYSDFEAWLTSGGDDRSLIKKTAANKVSSGLLRVVLYASLCIEGGKMQLQIAIG